MSLMWVSGECYIPVFILKALPKVLISTSAPWRWRLLPARQRFSNKYDYGKDLLTKLVRKV